MNEYDDPKQQDLNDQNPDHPPKATWAALLNFTTRQHAVPFATALSLAVASGIVVPALSIFLGKIFDAFTNFGAGTTTGDQLLDKLSLYGLALVGLGCSSWALNGGYFMIWLIFGELQAKGARDQLFDGMLEKDLEWFDLRKSGVGALLPRLQTSVSCLISKGIFSMLTSSTGKCENSKQLPLPLLALHYSTPSQRLRPSALRFIPHGS